MTVGIIFKGESDFLGGIVVGKGNGDPAEKKTGEHEAPQPGRRRRKKSQPVILPKPLLLKEASMAGYSVRILFPGFLAPLGVGGASKGRRDSLGPWGHRH